MKLKRLCKGITRIVLLLMIGFIAFLLYETQDEANADLNNIDGILESLCSKKRMGGFAVSVFTTDSVIYSKGFGYADVKASRPYTENTQQYIASISKTTIGIALLKAQELGLLELDDPVNKHLPFDVSNPKHPQAEITIRHLATHISSLDYNEKVVESLYISDREKSVSLEPVMKNYFEQGVYGEVTYSEYAPGTNWNYSNIGAGLAAFIIESSSGMPFSSFTKKYIFDPLELNNTYWFESRSDSLHHSKYYEADSDSIHEVSTSGVQLYPCRDMITDVKDLTKYCQAIISKDPAILRKGSFEELLRPNIPSSVSGQSMDNNGIFFFIDRNKYGVTYQLTGGTGGDNCMNTMMLFDPKTELAYVFIGNTGQSERNRANHILIYKALMSLGDHVLINDPHISLWQKAKYKWHNYYNRVRAFF